ncbi:MAG: extracellular solute-binding protein [Acaryochloris sp. RU_4_1]|nr:extracellular solute-binding protein [Acaryochloris sp. RU_4_1]NJR53524.1 extracellular solute-binding protein [Acaryochloris sp. CRU_2_0]
MDRRLFLQALSVVTLSQLLGACQQQNRPVLEVNTLQKALPPQLIGKFRSQSQISVQVGIKSSTQEIFSQLQQWQAQKTQDVAENTTTPQEPVSPVQLPHRVVSLGDYWLSQAIQQNLIQPLPANQLIHWSGLDPRWQQLVRRDRTGQPSANGDIWGAPFRWGATLIAYRPDKFKDLGWQPTTWSDLWRPELQGRISLLDQPREVIGLTLKRLQQSYNLKNLDAVSALPTELQALNRQVRFYASTQYLESLILGDTWVAVGWSTDILPALLQEPDIAAVFPQGGTALWADLWVEPRTSTTSTLAANADSRAVSQWINYWWEASVAANLSQFTSAISPLIPASVTSQSSSQLLIAHLDRFERSEFLLPLPPATLDQYQRLWQEMRRAI